MSLDDTGDNLPGDLQLLGNLPLAQSFNLVQLLDLLDTARYFTPKGRSIQAEGILPDVPLERVQLTAVEKSFEPLGERDLARHLDNPNGKGKPAKDVAKAAKPAVDEEGAKLAKADFGVHEALNLLKALNIVQQR